MSDGLISHPDAGPMTLLASWNKKSLKSGQWEQHRVYHNTFKAKHLLHFRVWFNQEKPQTDNGWRPGSEGFTVPENRLDEVLAAVEEARKRVHADGRCTKPSLEGEVRNPRAPRASERRAAEKEAKTGGQSVAERDRAYRKELDKGGMPPTLPGDGKATQGDAFDDLNEFRRNPK
jgi:hypothetical protein